MPQAVEFIAPADLRGILRGIALVTMLREPRVHFRDHWFRITPNGAMARWGDFAGNRCHFLFHQSGSVILGFDHESPMSPHATCTGPGDFRAWPGVYESLPAELFNFIRENDIEPEFDFREVTFCLWNLTTSRSWAKGDISYPEREYGDPDGERYVLNRIRAYYLDFTSEFRETYKWELDKEAVEELLSGDEITQDCLRRLQPNCDMKSVTSDLVTMEFRVL